MASSTSSTSLTSSAKEEEAAVPLTPLGSSPSQASIKRGVHSRQSSNPSITSPLPPLSLGGSKDIPETRGRRLSNHRPSVTAPARPQVPPNPVRSPVPMNQAELFDVMEKEQEAIVNKLQREISHLKSERSRSRSQSTSSSSSMSRNASVRSRYSISDAEDMGSKQAQRGSRTSFSMTGQSDDNTLIQQLRKENDQLKKKLADLSIKLTEKDHEIEHLSRTVRARKE